MKSSYTISTHPFVVSKRFAVGLAQPPLHIACNWIFIEGEESFSLLEEASKTSVGGFSHVDADAVRREWEVHHMLRLISKISRVVESEN